jgi:hypothetical protein
MKELAQAYLDTFGGLPKPDTLDLRRMYERAAQMDRDWEGDRQASVYLCALLAPYACHALTMRPM